MIHTNPDDMEQVDRFSGEAIDRKGGYVRHIEDRGRGYVMILLPYPKSAAPALIDHLKHGY